MTGAQTFSMHDTHATDVAVQRLFDEIKQYFFCGFNTHVVKVDRVRHAEIASTQPPDDSFLMTGPQEQEFLTGFQFARITLVLEQFLEYGQIILFPLHSDGGSFSGDRLYSAGAA